MVTLKDGNVLSREATTPRRMSARPMSWEELAVSPMAAPRALSPRMRNGRAQVLIDGLEGLENAKDLMALLKG